MVFENGLPLSLFQKAINIFPNTFKSSDVIDLLEKQCNKYNVQLMTSCEAINVAHIDNLFC